MLRLSCAAGIILAASLTGCSGTRMPAGPIQGEASLNATATPSSLVVEGIVQSAAAREVAILDPQGHEISLRITDQSTIWDGLAWLAGVPVEVGDNAIASGTWEGDRAAFIVQNLYVNAVNLRGEVEEVDEDRLQFSLADVHQGKSTVLVDPLTRIGVAGRLGMEPYQVLQRLPIMGDYVEVVGRKLADGAVLAATMTMP